MDIDTPIIGFPGRDEWYRYFRKYLGHLYLALGRNIGVWRLLSGDISSAAFSPSLARLLLGVIGRRTVGHSGRIRRIVRNVYGVGVRGSDQIVRKIRMGVPLGSLDDEIKVFRVEDREPIISLIEYSYYRVRSILERLPRGKEIIGEIDSRVESGLEATYRSIRSNPLNLVKQLSSCLPAISRIQPHLNPYSRIAISLRSITLGHIEMFYGSYRDIDDSLRSFLASGLEPAIAIESNGDSTIYSYREGSMLKELSELIYGVRKLYFRLAKTLRPYVRFRDIERIGYFSLSREYMKLSKVVPEARRHRDILGKLYRVAYMVRNIGNNIYVIGGKARIDSSSCTVYLPNSMAMRCTDFNGLVSLQSILSLSSLDIEERVRNIYKTSWKLTYIMNTR